MRKSLLAAMTLTLTGWAGLDAQVTTDPALLQEDSKNVVVYFHADEGNRGLANLPASTKVYAHTGVLTSTSKDDSDWQYAPTWGDNSDKYEMTYVSPNIYSLNIGDIRSYYGITNPSVTIKKLAFVFRNSTGSKEGKTETGGDIFVDVKDSGLQISLQSSISGTIVTPDNAQARFTVSTTEEADISLKVNGKSIGSASSAKVLTVDYTFEGPGTYMVNASAKAGDKTVYDGIRYVYTEPSPELAFDGTLRMGTTRNDDGTVTFCLAAPDKMSVMLLGSWDNFTEGNDHLMYRTTQDGFTYFWKKVEGLDKTTPYMYYYLVDAQTKVGDPYARLVLDPQNDKYISPEVYPDLPAYPSQVKDVCLAIHQDNLNDYSWKVKDFKGVPKENLVVYELLLRDFTGTEGQARGNGTLRQAIEKIPYLKSLNVNAIELLPINEFNGNNSWGYNPNFYFAPDKAYGTPDDYKEFIDACHQNGMAVILDMVFNQSDWQHPWYKLYPVGSNPFYNATAPHAYSVLNDWNQGYPLVRQQWKDVVRYWMEEYNVDGFRFDLVKGLGDNDSYANSGDSGTNAYNASRVQNMKAIKEAMDEVNPDAYFINENLAGAKEENEMARLGMLNWANVNNSGCQYAMGYSSNAALNRMWSMNDSRLAGSTVSYLESHDEQRLAYEQDTYGAEGVKDDTEVSMQRLGSAAAQMLMAPGAHMIWMFSEMGNAQNTKDATGGNNTSPKTVNWALLDEPNHKGLCDNYAELNGIRLANQDMFGTENYVTIHTGSSYWEKGRSIKVTQNGKELHLFVNPNITGTITMTDVEFDGTSNSDYRILSKSYGSTSAFNVEQKTVTVPANCYVVIANKKVAQMSGVEDIRLEKENGLMVRAGRGTLTVDGSGSAAEIYDPAGSLLRSGVAEGETVTLPAGLYIVRSGKETAKAIVK